MMVTTEESVGSVRRRADQHNKNIAAIEQSNATALKQDSKDELAEEPPQAELKEESISEKLEEEVENEEDGDRQEAEDPFVSQSKPSVVYEPPRSETSPGSQSSLEQITTLSITNSPSLSPVSLEENETRHPTSLEHNVPLDRDEPSSQNGDAVQPSLSSHSNASMKKNEEERVEDADEQTDHLNREHTSSETGSKTILTGPIPKPPQDIEVCSTDSKIDTSFFRCIP